MTPRKKQASALGGTVGVGDQASGDRFAEIRSSRQCRQHQAKGLWALGGSYGDRRGLGLIKPSTSTAARARNEAMSKPIRRRGVRAPALEPRDEGEGSWTKCQGFKPDLRNSVVRHYRGPRETQPWWNCEPASQAERARTVTLHLHGRRARALSQPRGNGEQQIGGTYGVWRLPSTQPVKTRTPGWTQALSKGETMTK
jgi:hypothetical protein